MAAAKNRNRAARADAQRDIARNRRALHRFEISDRFEAGLMLFGSEVKALRDRGASLGEAYGQISNGEAWIIGMHIPEYTNASMNSHEPTRTRKLLLNRREIERIADAVSQKGQTIVPLRLYFSEGGRAKLEIGIGRGRSNVDKRHAIKERDARREADRAMGTRRG